MLLDEPQLGRNLDRANHRLFRLETKDLYMVRSDGNDLQRYIDGDDGPDPIRKAPWLRQLRTDDLRGFLNQRVHVVTSPLNTYLSYECEWGYSPNAAAGEQIKILDLAEVEPPEGLLDEDFWLVDDDAAALRMHYDVAGRFLGAEPVDPGIVDLYVTAREAAWAAAVPFPRYWADHPQYWRDRAA